MARHLGTENQVIYNDKNSEDNGQYQIVESNTFSGDTLNYLLDMSSEEEERMPETKPMSVEMFTNIKPADHLVEHEVHLSTSTTIPSALSNEESITASTTVVSYTSKYESTLNSIEHWCLHDNDDANTVNCQCDNPLEPTSKTSSQDWYKAHEQNIDLLQQTAQQLNGQQLDVIFIGDSITEQRRGTILGQPNNEYTAIKEEFDMTFTKDKGGDYNGIALGISGDTTTNLLWRLIHGEMPLLQQNLTPKVWWIGIGINDLLKNNCSEDIVILGIKRIVEEIQNAQPNATIVINSILPIQTNGSGILEEANDSSSKCNRRMCFEWWQHIDTINKRLRKFSYENKGVNFFNADDIFIQEKQEGKYLNLNLMDDPVHPNVLGHGRWNGLIKKRLAYLIR